MKQYELEQKIKEYLKKDGRSQASIARKLECAPDTFNKWVLGVNRMPDTVIVAFCALLRLDDNQRNELLHFAGYASFANHQRATIPEARVAPGLVFATKIAANGLALNAGTEFPANISDLYAVYLPGMTPPGTEVNVPDPIANAYYAYLKVRGDATMASIGWRWYYEGEVVNEYQTTTKPGNTIWLQRYGYGKGGIFNGEPFCPGAYKIVILLGGNPALSSDLTITAGV